MTKIIKNLLTLKVLSVRDVTIKYVNWFLDKDVVRFSNNQLKKFTLAGQKRYVNKCLKDKNLVLFGIFYEKKHIGNICLDGLTSPHGVGEITYVIGDKTFWGKGIGSLVISKIILIAKKKYKLNKLIAGVANKNFGSIKILEKNKFLLEGVKKKHLVFRNNLYNQLDFGLLL